MKLKLTIKMDNAAFEADGQTRRFRNGSELARILRDLASQMSDCTLESGETFNLRDVNGNTVGKAEVL